MRIWSPCPVCGKCPWRPVHAGAAHGADVLDLDALKRWAATAEAVGVAAERGRALADALDLDREADADDYAELQRRALLAGVDANQTTAALRRELD